MFHIVVMILSLQGQPLAPPMAYKRVTFDTMEACEIARKGDDFKKDLAVLQLKLEAKATEHFEITTSCE